MGVFLGILLGVFLCVFLCVFICVFLCVFLCVFICVFICVFLGLRLFALKPNLLIDILPNCTFLEAAGLRIKKRLLHLLNFPEKLLFFIFYAGAGLISFVCFLDLLSWLVLLTYLGL
jgi:hypothetical protein